jgi:hypothetical protein
VDTSGFGLGDGSLVIVHCGSPREKMWGIILRLDGFGVVLRGMELHSVEDWLHQERSESERLITPSTFFLPMHRVQRVDLDESSPAAASFADRFEAACGQSVRDVLLEPDGTSR